MLLLVVCCGVVGVGVPWGRLCRWAGVCYLILLFTFAELLFCAGMRVVFVVVRACFGFQA